VKSLTAFDVIVVLSGGITQSCMKVSTWLYAVFGVAVYMQEQKRVKSFVEACRCSTVLKPKRRA